MLVTIATLAGASFAEVGLRRMGIAPAYQDSRGLWAQTRGRVIDDPRALAVLGTSQAQDAVDPVALAGALPGFRPYQLAITASSPITTLDDLARDPRFVGVALVEVTPSIMFATHVEKERVAAIHVQFYRDRAFVEPLETELRLAVQGALASARPEIRPTAILRQLLAGGPLIEASHVTLRRDRFAAADFSDVRDLASRRSLADRPVRTPPDAEWEERLEHIVRLEHRIRARGGRVVFLRMLRGGIAEERERRAFPRSAYWDRLAARVPSAIHAGDEPLLRDIECPDLVHMDAVSAREYSRRLGGLLLERGLLGQR